MQVTAKPKRGQHLVAQGHSSSQAIPARNIAPGKMVACFVKEYRDEIPQIAEVLEISDDSDDIVIHWWDGTYSGSWRALVKRQGRASVPWTEVLKKSNVLFEVSLTKGFKLPKATQEILRKAYDPLLAELDD